MTVPCRGRRLGFTAVEERGADAFFRAPVATTIAGDEALMNVQPNLQMDKTAFLVWVQGREENYELAEGRVVMMTGGTARHALVIGNLFELLRARLDRKRWRVMTEFGVDV